MKVSASRLPLFLSCVYWAREDVPLKHDPPGPQARLGSAVHEFADRYIRGEAEVEARDLAPIYDLTEAQLRRLILMAAQVAQWVDLNKQPADTWYTELAFAFDPKLGTSRVLGRSIGRDYEKHGLLPHELAGSADLIIVRRGSAIAEVYDWKTGYGASYARDDAQLLGLMLMALTAGEPWFADVTSATGTHLLVSDTGVTSAENAVMSQLDSLKFSRMLRSRVAAVPGSFPTPGPWCSKKYCQARSGCPEAQK